MGADACPVPEGEGSWLSCSQEKLTTEAPVNGGCNYDSPKVNHASLSKTKLYAGNSSYSFAVLVFFSFKQPLLSSLRELSKTVVLHCKPSNDSRKKQSKSARQGDNQQGRLKNYLLY